MIALMMQLHALAFKLLTEKPQKNEIVTGFVIYKTSKIITVVSYFFCKLIILRK